jgi:voltage-gated potassium channel
MTPALSSRIITLMDSGEGRKIWRLVGASVAILLAGTIGFMVSAHLSAGEAFYQALMILLTHFDHSNHDEPASRVITILLILCSFALIAYLLKWLAEYMMGLSGNVRKLRVKTQVDKLRNHYIVCGLGRVGSQVARELHNEGVPFVALDRDAAKVNEAIDNGYLALALDSTDDATLPRAGVEHANGLVASLGEDSLNLFVTLAARSVNPNLYIVARANRPENEMKLKRAGADRVAMPYQIGGYHMASMVLRPNVVDYMDVISGKTGAGDLEVEEMVVGEQSQLAGRRLGKTLAEGEIGATVIAINGADGTSRVRPTGKEIIYPGDRLVILGSKRDLTSASALIR